MSDCNQLVELKKKQSFYTFYLLTALIFANRIPVGNP